MTEDEQKRLKALLAQAARQREILLAKASKTEDAFSLTLIGIADLLDSAAKRLQSRYDGEEAL